MLDRPQQNASLLQRAGLANPASLILAFAPLIVFLLAFVVVAQDRERGTMRLALGAATHPAAIIRAKALAIWGASTGLLVLPVVGAALALATIGGRLDIDVLTRLALWVALMASYLALLAAIGIVVALRARDARIALALLFGIWIVAALVLPRAASSVADGQRPLPSSQAVRQQMLDEAAAYWTAEDSARHKAQLLVRHGVTRIEDIPNPRMAELDMVERHSHQVFDRILGDFYGQVESQDRLFSTFGLLSPTIAVQSLSAALAGSDFSHHHEFITMAERYRRDLVNRMNAAGISDLAPGRLDVKLNAIFGFNESYDFENPRGLALGRFDLGFALVYLLPIALILLYGLLVTFEQDHGMLRLVAAQSTGPRLWLGARVAAILAWTAPAILVSFLLSLGLAGVSFVTTWPELLAALLLVAAYILLWTGIAVLVLSPLPGAASALGTLAAIWTAMVIGLPLLGSILTSTLSPRPSGIAYIDARRHITDEIQKDGNAILKRAIAARPDLRHGQSRIDELDHATKLTFLIPETERRLAPFRAAMTAHAGQQAGITVIAGYLVPSFGLESSLATLAGTGDVRHRQFEAQTRAYQMRLRGILFPLVQREIATPTPVSAPATRGRLNLTDRDILPTFVMTDELASVRAVSVLPFAIWLLLLGGVLTTLGLRRAVTWPKDL